MKSIAFLKELEKSRKAVFGLKDVARLIGADEDYAKVYIRRLKQRGMVDEVERGKYSLEEPLLVAPNVVFPAYLSFLSGLSYHGLTTQIPRRIFVATTKSRAGLSYKNADIRFVKLAAKRFFGYRREMYGGKSIFVGEKEKVVTDSLFLPRYAPLTESYEAIKSGMDVGKLVEYGLRMDSIVLLKRLGYMLELAGVDVYPRVRNRLNTRLDRLNPLLPGKGKRDRKWGLLINEELG